MSKNNFFNWHLKLKKIKINWFVILCILLITLILIYIYNFNKPVTENFISYKKHIVKKNDQLYDDFYATIYDQLLYAEFKTDYEIGEIIKLFKTGQNNLILDVGSGTGHNVEVFNKNNIKAIGLDKSAAMVKKSKENYPNNEYKLGSVLQSNLFPTNNFNAITCLFFTIYYFKDKNLFFQNCYSWLKPNGILVVNLVNRDKFDPVLSESDPFYVSPQSITNKRITNSNITFNNMKYKSDFKLNGSKGLFIEKFINNNGTVRENHHELFMEKQSEILSMAKNHGFIYLAKIDLEPVEYKYQYLYVLKKPN